MKLLALVFLAAAHLAFATNDEALFGDSSTIDAEGLPGRLIYNKQKKPILDLPYGKFEAVQDREGIWTFKDIPYAAAPVGELRWKKPVPPEPRKGKQERNRNLPNQVWMHDRKPIDLAPGKVEWRGTPNSWVIGGLDEIFGENPGYTQGDQYSEDCLTLDITVSDRALSNPWAKLPVAVFIYGGVFMAGAKDKGVYKLPLYDGHGLVSEADGDIIFVAFNYRVGAFGFLGGTTTEKQAVPNVGLWDQRAAFQWVQDYIHLVSGDRDAVTAIGHSAGASSIMFHLTAEGGTLDPLYKYAILMSPSYMPKWDRDGDIEDTFKEFESLAGCEDLGFDCLRNRTTEQLQYANQEVALRQHSASDAYGPVPDGTYIRQLPMLEWAQGNVWPIEKVIITHTSKEKNNTVSVDTSAHDWSQSYLSHLMPDRDVKEGWVDKILDTYPYWNPMEKHWSHDAERYQTELDRMQHIALHTCTTCHMRWLTEALGTARVFLVYYNIFPYKHGADLIPLFWPNRRGRWKTKTALHEFFQVWIQDPVWSNLHHEAGFQQFVAIFKGYRRFFTEFIMHGGKQNGVPAEPPTFGSPETADEQLVKNVLSFAFRVRDDIKIVKPTRWYRTAFNIEVGTMPKSKCDFWMDFYQKTSESGNYTLSD